MCKKSLLMMLLLALLVPWAANAQTTVEIGDGTTTDYYTPIGTYYNYSITEQLYTAEEIGTAGTISSISFSYASSTAKDFPITVYMANVDAENLSTGISLADADEVFNGTLSVTGAGWATITLDTPFAYDGTSNLLIGVIKDYVYWYSDNTWYHTTTDAVMARYTQNDNNPYDTSTVPVNTRTARPNIQIAITPGSGPVCDRPETFEVSNVTANSATLTWTGGSGTYNVEYKGGTITEWTSYLTNTTATTANLSGLTPGTAYQYRVQCVCGSDVSGWKSVSFSTMFGIPLVEGFGTAIPSGWSIYSGLVETVLAGGDLTTASYGWSFGSNNGVFDNHARVNIYGTGCNYWLVLPTLAMEDNVQLMFDVAYTAYSGTGAPALTGEDDKFVVLVNNGRTWEIVRQWDNAGSEYVLNDLNTTPITVAIDLSNYAEAGQPITVAFYGESTVSNADNNLHIDNVSIDYIPACQKPTNLAVNYEGGTEVTVSWESPATAWQIGYSTDGFVTEQYVEVTENPYTLTGLELGTNYEVRVQTNCGDGIYSVFTNSVSFKTDNCMPENMCALTFTVTDSYGDGWNGASIQVYDYTNEEIGELLAEITNQNLDGVSGSSQTEPETQIISVNFCDGQQLAIIWNEGSFDSECSYTITDLNGDVVVEGSGEGFDAFAYTINCTVTDCRKPSDFAASEIASHSVVLSWTENGPATEWVIAYISENDEEISYITTSENPYTLTGLDPETMYAAQVTPVCEVDKPSEVIYWTTDVACPKPTNLNVTAYTTSADVAWEGLADAYDLEWALLPATESKDPYNDGNWYYYDNGTYVGSVGLGGGEFHWGVMFPAGTYEGTLVSKVKAYDINAMVGTLAIYNDGETAPANQISIQDVEFTGAGDWVEFETYANIDPTKNVWVVFDAVDGAAYPIGTSNDDNGDANGRWVEISGTWYDMADVGVEGRANMLRAYIEEGFNPEELDWNPVSGITSPYTIEGLQPETTYVVRVKAVCGGDDGESAWTMTTFTTHSACDMPNTFSAEVEATSATLSWVGYQESYNLRYRRTPYAVTTYFSEDFDEGLPATWTTIDNDTTTVGNWIALSEINSVYTYYTSPLTGWAHSGADAVASASYVNGVGSVATDNYLVTPQVTFNGKLRFYATSEYEDPDTYEVLLSTTGNSISDFNVTLQAMGPATYGAWDEVIIDLSDYAGQQGYIAIHHVATDKYWLVIDDFGMYDFVYEDWTNVTATENTYTATGLTPEAEYEWQIQGINEECGELEWSEIQNFTTPEQTITTITQTIELNEGWNWVSIYLENEDPEEMMLMLQEALGENGLTIAAADDYTTYADGEWGDEGDLEELSNDRMYMIEVAESCTVVLRGMPADPADYTITIVPGWNWIGFPSAEAISIEDAFADFEAEDNDMIVCPFGYTTFVEEWGDEGELEELTPGVGYMYFYNGEDEQDLVIQTGDKARRIMNNMHKPLNLKVKAVVPVSDLSKTAKVEQSNTKKLQLKSNNPINY